jgi:hypothetical protein
VTVTLKELTALRKTAESQIQLRWEIPSCAPEATVHSDREVRTSAANSFSDNDLRARVNAKKSGDRGVIYTWSPHMPLSITGLAEIEALAKKLSFDLIVLLDPNASTELAGKVAAKHKMPNGALRKVASHELIQREVLYHYPSYTYFRNGMILGPIRLGYDAPMRLEKQVRARLLE